MKKLFYSIVFLSVLSVLLTGTLLVSNAQTYIPTFENDNIIRFSDLELQDTQLFAPYDVMQLQFGLPPEYSLTANSAINLDITTFISGTDVARFSGSNAWLGRLDVYFNNVLVYQLDLVTEGQQSVTIPISGDALLPAGSFGRHTLELQFTSDINCIYDVFPNVTVSNTSSMYLPYEEVSPSLNLVNFPAPLFQRDSIVQSKALLVVPDNATVEEMDAAMLVSTNLGSISTGNLQFELKTASQVSPETDSDKHIILVGLSSSSYGSFTDEPFLLKWRSGYTLTNADDGVVQIAYSPLNSSKAILHVSGNTPAGLRKAAQAFNAVPFYVTEDFRFVKIADVVPNAAIVEPVTDVTFEQLGYVEEPIQSIGVNYIDIEFDVAPEQINTQSAYLDLRLNYSKLINPDISLLTVFLNGTPIGSVDFKPENSDFQTYRFNIPPGLLRINGNLLEIMADLAPLYSCTSTAVASVWVNVSNLSLLHIPLATAADAFINNSTLGINFLAFPAMFVEDVTLSDLALILPSDKPAAWSAAGSLMYYMGNETNLSIPDFTVAYADSVSDEIKQNFALLIFGQATELPIIQELGEALPAPFADGSNVPTEKGMKVIYSIPEGIDLGYLELFKNPWNNDKPALAVLGSSDTGVSLAGSALVVPELAQTLAGDFAVSNGKQVLSANSRLSAGRESVIDQIEPSVDVVPETETEVPTGQTGTQLEPVATPPWMMTVLAISSGVIILILAVVLISNIVRGRKSRYINENKKEE